MSISWQVLFRLGEVLQGTKTLQFSYWWIEMFPLLDFYTIYIVNDAIELWLYEIVWNWWIDAQLYGSNILH